MPTKGSSSRTETLTIRVGPQLRATIDKYAQAREMTAGEFVRYAVRLYVETTPVDPNSDGDA